MPLHPTYGFVKKKKKKKKKRAAFGGELVVSGDGGGRWGMVSQGRGYDFDVCARLENSTITPSLIFLKFFPKISKSDDCTWVFYCLKWRPGKIKKIGELFSKIFIFFLKFFPKKYVYFDRFSKFFLESHRSLESSTVYGQKIIFSKPYVPKFCFLLLF